MEEFNVVFLGTGTSQGVPVIGCTCEVCQSNNPKDKRLRTSLLIKYKDQQIVIDTGPDFRQQMLREQVSKLDAVLFTHEHKDHIAGLDDIRAFNFKSGMPMEVFLSKRVEAGLQKEFHYIFSPIQYPGIPKLNLNYIDKTPFQVNGIQVTPIEVMHYKLPVTAFRIGNFSYVTDANKIAPEEFEKLKGTDFLVINALRKEKHISHFNLEEALEIIEKINPKMAYLTHLSHLMGTHEKVSELLPENVQIAFDGLSVNVN
jgi:phosphoribosyl 1,2-cyclic phosphate phosphodiesterase